MSDYMVQKMDDQIEYAQRTYVEMRETIDRLERELAEAKARETDWINHPEIIESKRQWDAVAIALGADKDCPDSVLSAAKARASLLPDGWVAVPEELTLAMMVAIQDEIGSRSAHFIWHAALDARPQSPKAECDG